MIFVTIGTQEPFDRLIKAIDELAPKLSGIPVFAQAIKGNYVTKNISTFEFLPPKEFSEYFTKASLIVAHAGMGTIISALTTEKPIIVMPRLAELGEHRNNHQMATAQRFAEMDYIKVAFSEEELSTQILELIQKSYKARVTLGRFASVELRRSIEDFILS